MGKAARAIIIEDGRILVMRRRKNGAEYYTLAGGRVDEGENIEQAVIREIKEETGMDVTAARMVFYEQHPEPYNEQYIFLCEVAPHGPVAVQNTSEEAELNKMRVNVHTPEWVGTKTFPKIPFRTPQLQTAIAQALKKGFPAQAVKL